MYLYDKSLLSDLIIKFNTVTVYIPPGFGWLNQLVLRLAFILSVDKL